MHVRCNGMNAAHVFKLWPTRYCLLTWFYDDVMFLNLYEVYCYTVGLLFRITCHSANSVLVSRVRTWRGFRAVDDCGQVDLCARIVL